MSLDRFLDAQKNSYTSALKEISNGNKQSHWMWFIFPQIEGLGHSDMAKRYAIKNLEEAEAYLNHPILGPRLIEISKAMLHVEGRTASQILGYPDDMKLRSSMTLFNAVPGADLIFREVLKKYFAGKGDERTLELMS